MSKITQQVLDGVTVAGARAFWRLKDLEARRDALRVRLMTLVSDPHLDWPTARAELTAALNADMAEERQEQAALLEERMGGSHVS